MPRATRGAAPRRCHVSYATDTFVYYSWCDVGRSLGDTSNPSRMFNSKNRIPRRDRSGRRSISSSARYIPTLSWVGDSSSETGSARALQNRFRGSFAWSAKLVLLSGQMRDISALIIFLFKLAALNNCSNTVYRASQSAKLSDCRDIIKRCSRTEKSISCNIVDFDKGN